MNCFRAWEETALYSQDLLIKLQNIFLGLIPTQSLKTSTEKATTEYDIDGVPIDPDLDGQELDDDGFEIEARNDTRFTQSFKPSKWETSDKVTSIFDEEGGDEDEDIDGEPLEDNDYFENLLQQKKTSKPNSNKPYNNNNNNQTSLTREVLRDIELKVIKYQDNLDSDIRKGRFVLQFGETVDTLVERYRDELKRKALSGNVDTKASVSQSSRRDRSPSSPRSRYHSTTSSSTRKHSHSPRRSRSRSPVRRK